MARRSGAIATGASPSMRETLLNYDYAITAIRVGSGLTDRSSRAK
jgi:hypothetical protein